jgi:ATP-binding cassette subfamily F protein 3
MVPHKYSSYSYEYMIQFEQLSLRRGERELFANASLRINPGSKVAIVGANGCGKSSLFAMLLGEMMPDDGSFSIPPDWVLSHVAQELPDDERMAIDYVLSGDNEWTEINHAIKCAEAEDDGDALSRLHELMDRIDGYTARSRASRLMHGLGFNTEDEVRPLNAFSGGWRVRLNLARALICRSDVLLLDEPTNHLDLEAVIWLEGWLRSYQGTLLLISHDRDFIDAVATEVIHFDHQKLLGYKGGYSAFEAARAERLSQQQVAYERQQAERQRIQSFVDRFRAKATKARQAQSRLRLLEKMELVAPAYAESPFHFQFELPERQPHTLIRMEGVLLGYDAKPLLSEITVSIEAGDRLVLLGKNGAGKSTFMRYLLNSKGAMAGEVERHKDLSVGYFSQHHAEQLNPADAPLDLVQRRWPAMREQEIRDFLGGFGFHGDQVLATVGRLSGGERARVLLALMVLERPNLLLLDEPTNHLDLDMRQALTVALQGFEGAIVLVSHDRHLISSVGEDYWQVGNGRVIQLKGGLQEYTANLVSEEQATEYAKQKQHGAEARKDKRRRSADLRKQTQPLRQAITRIDQELDKIRSALTNIESQLGDQAIYNEDSKDRLQDCLKEQGALKGRQEVLEMEWLVASEELERLTAEMER